MFAYNCKTNSIKVKLVLYFESMYLRVLPYAIKAVLVLSLFSEEKVGILSGVMTLIYDFNSVDC